MRFLGSIYIRILKRYWALLGVIGRYWCHAGSGWDHPRRYWALLGVIGRYWALLGVLGGRAH